MKKQKSKEVLLELTFKNKRWVRSHIITLLFIFGIDTLVVLLLNGAFSPDENTAPIEIVEPSKFGIIYGLILLSIEVIMIILLTAGAIQKTIQLINYTFRGRKLNKVYYSDGYVPFKWNMILFKNPEIVPIDAISEVSSLIGKNKLYFCNSLAPKSYYMDEKGLKIELLIEEKSFTLHYDPVNAKNSIKEFAPIWGFACKISSHGKRISALFNSTGKVTELQFKG